MSGIFPATSTLARQMTRFLAGDVLARQGCSFIDVSYSGANFRAISIVNTDDQLHLESMDYLTTIPQTWKTRDDLESTRRVKAGLPVTLEISDEPRRLLTDLLGIVDGRLPIGHGLGRDLVAVHGLAVQAGINAFLPANPVGMDTNWLARAKGHDAHDLKSVVSALGGFPDMAECPLTDALRTLHIAQRYAPNLEALKRLTLEQMEQRSQTYYHRTRSAGRPADEPE